MILVTGGTGMLGSQLLVQLTARGLPIKALRRKTSDLILARKMFDWYSSDPDTHWQQIQWVEGDLLDSIFLEELLEGVNQVYHCAAMVSFDPADRYKLHQVNTEGTARLVNALLLNPHIRLCHVSSIAAIGFNEDGNPADENTVWKYERHTSAYAYSKYNAEREVWRGIAEGLNAVIVNPSVILGPGNWQSGSSALFSLAYKGMPFYTHGTTGYVDVRDVARVMIRLMELSVSGERFVVSAANLSYEEFFTLTAKALHRRPPHIKIQPWMSEIAWRFYAIKGLITGKRPTITRETARNAQKKRSYSSEKLQKLIGFSYLPIGESIQHIAELFLKDTQLE